ncbi:MAG: hypothetical protein ACKO23_03810 [Gemmataceae bacterium]
MPAMGGNMAPGGYPGMMPPQGMPMPPQQGMPRGMVQGQNFAPTQDAVPRPRSGDYHPPRLAPQTARPPAQTAAATAPAPRLARGARGSDPAPNASRSMNIPTPEELGISGTSAPTPAVASTFTPSSNALAARDPQTLDWTVARKQMTEMGVVRFQLEHLNSGGARFSCWLRGDSSRMVQADGDSESEAVQTCLERARQHVANRR